MFPISSVLRFYLYTQPTDMRKSFDGLCGIVTAHLEQDPTCGAVFLFLNRRRDRIKLLVWDRNGFWILYKRLEQGRFQIPVTDTEKKELLLPYETIIMLLEGIDLSSIKRRKRYQKLQKQLV
jgi:transposase